MLSLILGGNLLPVRGPGRLRWALIAFMCFLGFHAMALEDDSLADDQAPFSGTSLEAYLQRADEANPGLRAFGDRYEGAMKRVPQAGALPDPRFQITSFVESVQTRTGSQENVIMVAQTIPWFGKLNQRKEAASREAEALWFLYQARQLGLARAVSVAFFEYGYTGKAIELTEENLGLLRRLESVVEERVRGGGDLNSLLRLRVEVGRMEDRVKTFEQKREEQSAYLDGLLGRAAGGVLPWPEWEAPESRSLDSGVLIAALETNNPELAMLDRKIASAQARRELARLENRPNLTFGVNYIQLDAYSGSTLPDAGRDPWGVVIGLNLPIWGSKNEAVRAAAQSAHSAARYERRDRENMLKAELSARFSSLNDANRQLKFYGEDLLNLAHQALENTRTSYESGSATILEVIDSERSLLELQLEYWRAAAESWQDQIVIQTLVNQPIAGTFVPTSNR